MTCMTDETNARVDFKDGLKQMIQSGAKTLMIAFTKLQEIHLEARLMIERSKLPRRNFYILLSTI